MAVRTQTRRHRVTSRQRETGAAVMEGGIGPRRRVMALITCLREAGRNVIRVCGSLIVLQMTRYASRARQGVVIVDMAIDALTRWNGVQAGQRETRTVVIEGRICPRSRVVALIARLGETRGDVVRIGRSLIVLQMATDAGRRAQVVVVIYVAIGALPRWHGVQAGKREGRGIVVE